MFSNTLQVCNNTACLFHTWHQRRDIPRIHDGVDRRVDAPLCNEGVLNAVADEAKLAGPGNKGAQLVAGALFRRVDIRWIGAASGHECFPDLRNTRNLYWSRVPTAQARPTSAAFNRENSFTHRRKVNHAHLWLAAFQVTDKSSEYRETYSERGGPVHGIQHPQRCVGGLLWTSVFLAQHEMAGEPFADDSPHDLFGAAIRLSNFGSIRFPADRAVAKHWQDLCFCSFGECESKVEYVVRRRHLRNPSPVA